MAPGENEFDTPGLSNLKAELRERNARNHSLCFVKKSERAKKSILFKQGNKNKNPGGMWLSILM